MVPVQYAVHQAGRQQLVQLEEMKDIVCHLETGLTFVQLILQHHLD